MNFSEYRRDIQNIGKRLGYQEIKPKWESGKKRFKVDFLDKQGFETTIYIPMAMFKGLIAGYVTPDEVSKEIARIFRRAARKGLYKVKGGKFVGKPHKMKVSIKSASVVLKALIALIIVIVTAVMFGRNVVAVANDIMNSGSYSKHLKAYENASEMDFEQGEVLVMAQQQKKRSELNLFNSHCLLISEKDRLYRMTGDEDYKVKNGEYRVACNNLDIDQYQRLKEKEMKEFEHKVKGPSPF